MTLDREFGGFGYYADPAPGKSAAVRAPLWFLSLLPWAPTLARLARRRRRARRAARGLCPACGYDLRASDGRCPECGAAALGKPGD